MAIPDSKMAALVKNNGITQSISRKVNGLDNATIEYFFVTLKAECHSLNGYKDVEYLRRDTIRYIYYYINLE